MNRAARRLPGLALLRPLGAMLLLALLAACASMQPNLPAAQEAADYRAHARHYYAPPGPPEDPWGPYVREAARRFDVPETWIRAVMHQESGDHEFINGQFVTSAPGAMGLMQLMPPTYDDMRTQYGLGPDPYDPHDNILAGAAYMRQMYDIYGSPGFLAAYNTGPGRLDDFLTRDRSLPHETRQYVAIIGRQIAGTYPSNRSPADLLVMNQRRAAEEADRRRSQDERVALERRDRGRRRGRSDEPIRVAEAPASFRTVSFRTPLRATVPQRAENGHWAIQVGAFDSQRLATEAVNHARARASPLLPHARAEIAGIRTGRSRAHLYRARLTGLTHDDAMRACQRLRRGPSRCVVITPDGSF